MCSSSMDLYILLISIFIDAFFELGPIQQYGNNVLGWHLSAKEGRKGYT